MFMCFKFLFFLFLLIPLLGFTSDSKVEFYLTKVKPLLKSECYKCHSHESGKSKGGLMLDSVNAILKGGGSGPAIIPGNAQKSRLIHTVKRLDEDEAMPPKKTLTKDQISILEKWIQDGAHGPKSEIQEDRTLEKRAKELWSFQPVKNYAKSNSYIDQFVDFKLKSKGLKPLMKADPIHLIRRVYLDLIGIPPKPEEVEAYLKNPSEQAFEKIVDDLLSRPQFGERWARHWLDTARYADCNGGDRTHVFHQAWKYRNWVIDAHNEDLPYDQFIIQQLAGDLLPAKNDEQKTKQMTATGFLAIGSKPLPNREHEVDEKNLEMLLDPIDAVSMGMMGISVGCAKCHDHKFDPIPTTDYYALAGIFKSTRIWYGPTFGYLPLQKDGGFEAHTHLLDPNLYTLDQNKQKDFEPIQKKHWEIAWRHKKLVGRTKFLKNHIKKKKTTAQQKAEYEKELVEVEAEIKHKEVELAEFEKKNKTNIEQIMAATDSTPSNVKVRYAGDFNNVGPKVPRGLMKLLPVPGADLTIPANSSGRLQLAKWIAHKKNPLTARVAVNRLWYHLFGKGIVESLDNLGASGTKPTHPKLLDSMAYQFMNEFNWSRKAMIRQIVLSKAYQRSAVVDESNVNLKKDPLNHFLWRMVPRRLEAEIIRDSILAVSGRLNSERPKRSIVEKFKYSVTGRLDGGMARVATEEIYGINRTIYVPVFRLSHNRILNLFDYPDDEAVNSHRSSNVFATQGLFLMNNKLVTESASRFAWEILRDKSLQSDEARINRAYLLAYSRRPLSEEVKKDLQFLKVMGEGSKGAWESFCQSLLVSSEFLYRF